MEKKKDFLISYNNTDRSWAEWVAWELEESEYSTILQAWDFRPGSNFVVEMDQATARAERTIAVLSPDYLGAKYTHPEWAAAFSRDPTGADRILVPVCVRKVDVKGLLRQIVYIDLVGLDERDASRTLLDGVRRGRAKPKAKPRFPPEESRSIPQHPPFPGAASVEESDRVSDRELADAQLEMQRLDALSEDRPEYNKAGTKLQKIYILQGLIKRLQSEGRPAMAWKLQRQVEGIKNDGRVATSSDRKLDKILDIDAERNVLREEANRSKRGR